MTEKDDAMTEKDDAMTEKDDAMTERDDALLNEFNKHMPMLAVRYALMAAAGGTDSRAVVDRVDKVAVSTHPNPARMSRTLRLSIWWRLTDDNNGDAEYHVVVREQHYDTDTAYDFDELQHTFENLLDFKPEDVLKFAAYL